MNKYEKFIQFQKVIWKHNEISLIKYGYENLTFALSVGHFAFYQVRLIPKEDRIKISNTTYVS